MGDVATPLVRAGSHLLSRHQSAIGIVAWILILLVVGNIVLVVVGRIRNRGPERKGAIRTATLAPNSLRTPSPPANARVGGCALCGTIWPD